MYRTNLLRHWLNNYFTRLKIFINPKTNYQKTNFSSFVISMSGIMKTLLITFLSILISFSLFSQNDTKQQLNSLKSQFDSISIENEHIKSELKRSQENIKKLLEQADSRSEKLSQLRKETENVREIMKGYLLVIDSLSKTTEHLKNQNNTLQSNSQHYAEITDYLEVNDLSIKEITKDKKSIILLLSEH